MLKGLFRAAFTLIGAVVGYGGEGTAAGPPAKATSRPGCSRTR